VISSITADYAKNFEKEEKWEAKNNVVATNAQGDTLKTEHLIWEEKAEIIYTEEFVRIIRSDQIITGIGFHSDQSMQNWRIKNPKGTIYIEMNEPGQTSADTSSKTHPLQIPLRMTCKYHRLIIKQVLWWYNRFIQQLNCHN
jgi:hypothetical protein